MRRSLCITASLLGAAALTGAIHTFEEVVVEADIGGRMGRSFVVVPDVNGDGIDELLLGDGEWDGSAGSQQGNATLHLGTPDGPDPIPAWTTTGVAAANRLGASVSTGDFNGDDHADLVIGAYNATGGLHQDAGRVYVF